MHVSVEELLEDRDWVMGIKVGVGKCGVPGVYSTKYILGVKMCGNVTAT